MKVYLMGCYGLYEALYGLGLSYGVTSNISFTQFKARPRLHEKMMRRALIQAPLDGGHNKFLEHIQTWWMIKASRAYWSQFDTYRIGVSKQSESTMHTIKKRLLEPGDFHPDTEQSQIDTVNKLIQEKVSVEKIKVNLPEGFLQSREVNISFKSLINCYQQRKNHKLGEWQEFIRESIRFLPKRYKELLLMYSELEDTINK